MGLPHRLGSVTARTAFSLLFPPILNEFGWDRGVTAGAFSSGFLVSAVLSPFIGRLMDHRGPRVVIEMGVGVMTAGLLLAPLVREPWHLYAALGMLVGAGGGVSRQGNESVPCKFAETRVPTELVRARSSCYTELRSRISQFNRDRVRAHDVTGWIIWGGLLGGSVLVGFICARFMTGWLGATLSGAIPWSLLLAYLLVAEYVLPYSGGGASMWPIAQLVAGTIVACVGVMSFRVFERKA